MEWRICLMPALCSPVQPESHCRPGAPTPRPSLVRTVCICSAAIPQRFLATRDAQLARQASGGAPPWAAAAGRRAQQLSPAVGRLRQPPAAGTFALAALFAPRHTRPPNLSHPDGTGGGRSGARSRAHASASVAADAVNTLPPCLAANVPPCHRLPASVNLRLQLPLHLHSHFPPPTRHMAGRPE